MTEREREKERERVKNWIPPLAGFEPGITWSEAIDRDRERVDQHKRSRNSYCASIFCWRADDGAHLPIGHLFLSAKYDSTAMDIWFNTFSVSPETVQMVWFYSEHNTAALERLESNSVLARTDEYLTNFARHAKLNMCRNGIHAV